MIESPIAGGSQKYGCGERVSTPGESSPVRDVLYYSFLAVGASDANAPRLDARNLIGSTERPRVRTSK